MPGERRWLRILRDVAEVMFILGAFGALLLWCSVPDTSKLVDENPDSTAFIDLRKDENPRLKLQWTWRPIGRISRYLRAAVIYAEDYNFYRHDGVDWGALEHAVENDLSHGQLAVGGSTITQQLAKNLYLSPNKSFIRKLREMLIAFSLEDDLGKQRILELYLNVVEWGDGIYGAEAAARAYFRRSAAALDSAQSALLAGALVNPRLLVPSHPSARLLRRQRIILSRMGSVAPPPPAPIAPIAEPVVDSPSVAPLLESTPEAPASDPPPPPAP